MGCWLVTSNQGIKRSRLESPGTDSLGFLCLELKYDKILLILFHQGQLRHCQRHRHTVLLLEGPTFSEPPLVQPQSHGILKRISVLKKLLPQFAPLRFLVRQQIAVATCGSSQAPKSCVVFRWVNFNTHPRQATVSISLCSMPIFLGVAAIWRWRIWPQNGVLPRFFPLSLPLLHMRKLLFELITNGPCRLPKRNGKKSPNTSDRNANLCDKKNHPDFFRSKKNNGDLPKKTPGFPDFAATKELQKTKVWRGINPRPDNPTVNLSNYGDWFIEILIVAFHKSLPAQKLTIRTWKEACCPKRKRKRSYSNHPFSGASC